MDLYGLPGIWQRSFREHWTSDQYPLLAGFVAVCIAELVVGALLWNGTPAGIWLSFALLPFEFAYWIGFALPFGPVFGIIRTILVIIALRG